MTDQNKDEAAIRHRDSDDDPNIPIAIEESTIEFMGINVRVYVLDNGQRVVHSDDVHRLFDKMNSVTVE